MRLPPGWMLMCLCEMMAQHTGYRLFICEYRGRILYVAAEKDAHTRRAR